MNELELIFADLFAFIDELIKDYGEPISPTTVELEQLKYDIVNHDRIKAVHLPDQFFLIERVAGEILFSLNLDKFLGLTGEFDLLTFHSYIDDGTGNYNYLREYLTWGKATYMFFNIIGKQYDPLKFCMKTRLPMRFSDGKIYWVQQESHPLEIDAEWNLISHLNTYTIGGVYHEKKPVPLSIEIFYENHYVDEWNQLLADSRFAIRPFSISPIQRNILKHYHQNPDATTITCANQLKYPRNTIKKYISDSRYKQGIIDLAKAAFPHIKLNCIKDVVAFLDKIAWYDRNDV